MELCRLTYVSLTKRSGIPRHVKQCFRPVQLLAIESITAAIESAVGISTAEEAAIDSGAFVSDVSTSSQPRSSC